MHILILTDNCPIETNASASRTHEHTSVWVAAGHWVTVINCAPNFPKGRVFDGYSNRLAAEMLTRPLESLVTWEKW